MEIKLEPYKVIEDQSFHKVVIRITPEVFKDTEYQSNTTVLNFVSCQFDELQIINEIDINFEKISINFSSCLITNVKVESIKSNQIDLGFFGCIVSGNIQNNKLTSVNLNNCVTPSLFLQNQNRVDISYTEENIFLYKWRDLLNKFKINSIEELISLNQSVFVYHSKQIRCHFRQIKPNKSRVYRAPYEPNPLYRVRYGISHSEKRKLNINLIIDFSKVEDEFLKISNCILNSLELKGSSEGAIRVENTEINNFYFRDFNSESETLLYNIHPYSSSSKLEIHKSNMDNTWFDNIDFDGYLLLSFFQARFANASFTSCNFPKDSLNFEKFKTLENIHYPDIKPQNYYKDQYEIFLQLKKSLEGTGNYFEAQKLSAISKEALRQVSSLSSSDKFILWLNSISNNHGLSIKSPIKGLLFFSIIFYIFYLLSVGRIFNSTKIDWTIVGHYFSFIDITHRQDFIVSKSEFTFFTLMLDYVNKVFVGFFIFQFISAFRKYVKK